MRPKPFLKSSSKIIIISFGFTVTLEVNLKTLKFTTIFNLFKFCSSAYNLKQNFR